MKIKGIELKASAEKFISYYDVRAAVDWVIAHFGLADDAFEGITIRALPSNQKSVACYQGWKKTITFYARQCERVSKTELRSVIVHELVHVLQRGVYGGYKPLNDAMTTISAVKKGKDAAYFLDPIEIEAFVIQYNYLKSINMEVLLDYYVKIYAGFNINLPSLPSHTPSS